MSNGEGGREQEREDGKDREMVPAEERGVMRRLAGFRQRPLVRGGG